MQYTTYFQKVSNLPSSKIDQMASIYFDYFEGSTYDQFFNDLEAKNEVLFLEYNQKIVGFSSLQFYQHEQSMIVYSGDTIIKTDHRQQQIFHKAWAQRLGYLKKQYPTMPLYWFLLIKGYKTFKYLILFIKHFYPHWEYQDSKLMLLAQSLATDKFGDLYQNGVILCPPEYGYLKHEFSELSNVEKNRPSAQFFLEMNPFYHKGHELVCLCELSRENIHPKLLKYFDEAHVVFKNE